MFKYDPEIKKTQTLSVFTPYKHEKMEIVIPPCYYISKDGDICNGMGDKHKYTYIAKTYSMIFDAFMGKKININDELTTISLKDLYKHDLNRLKYVIENNRIDPLDSLEYLGHNCCELANPKVVALTLNNIKARIIFLDKFIKLETNSLNPLEDLKTINRLTNNEVNDVLIRYCDFSKIVLDKNSIVTSSIHFEDFIDYLDHGWDVHYTPKLDLSGKIDLEPAKIALSHFLEDNPTKGKIKNIL